MANYETLKDMVDNRQSRNLELMDLQHQVQDCDRDIKRLLVEMNEVEPLAIQWGKLRRMLRV